MQRTLTYSAWTNTVAYLGHLTGVRGYPKTYYYDDGNTFEIQRLWVGLTIGGTTYRLDPPFKVNLIHIAADERRTFATRDGLAHERIVLVRRGDDLQFTGVRDEPDLAAAETADARRFILRLEIIEATKSRRDVRHRRSIC